MKSSKCFSVLLILVLCLVLNGCDGRIISDATEAYEEKNYTEVVSLLEDFDGQTEETQTMLDISKGMVAYEEGNYQEALDILKDKELQEDQKTVLDECAVNVYKSLIDNAVGGKPKEFTSRINEYISSGFRSEEVDSHIAALFEDKYTSKEYDDFIFADKVIKKIENKDLKTIIQELKSNHEKDRVIAFLNGDWVRKDGTNLSGTCISVSADNDGFTGIIKSVNGKGKDLGFAENDVKWKEGNIVDKKHITFDDLIELASNSEYGTSSGTINFKYYQINTHSSSKSARSEYKYGTNQVWIKKDYADKYKKIKDVTKKDFVLKKVPKEEEEIIDYDKDLYKYLKGFDAAGVAFSYGCESDYKVVDHRGIKLGSAKDEVIDAYGIGYTNIYDQVTDPLYDGYNYKEQFIKSFKKSKSFIAYGTSDLNIKFYFDKNDKVCMEAFGTEQSW